MTQSGPRRPRNALSNSPSGECYTGLGCFPLGHHTSRTEINELIEILRSLRVRKMLHLVSPSTREEIKTHLEPLQQAQVFWAHHPSDAPQARAVHELLDLLSSKSNSLQIYVFPDSARLTSGAPVIWGLSELDVRSRKTYLYISGAQADLAGTVLHTFLSSRKVSRLQCFLAEYVLADQAERLTEDWELPERLQEDVGLLTREELEELRERLEREGKLEAPVLLAKLAGLCEEVLEKSKEPVWWAENEGGWI